MFCIVVSVNKSPEKTKTNSKLILLTWNACVAKYKYKRCLLFSVSEASILFFSQGYQARGGKETCWFLGCCIHGVLSQGEWGNDRYLFEYQLIDAYHVLILTQIQTLMKIFLQCRQLWRFSSGSFWRWRKLMEMHPQRRRSAPWCKIVSRTSVSSIAEDRRHNFTSFPTVTSPTPRHCSWTFLLHCDTRLIYLARQLPRHLINHPTNCNHRENFLRARLIFVLDKEAPSVNTLFKYWMKCNL